MNETWNWDDLRLFLSVARQGGLAKAVPETRVSAPTLSRRMTALERTLGVTLFRRHRDGYALTTAGLELLEHAEALERGALGVDRWRSAGDRRPVVKIAAGSWMSAFVARHMATLVDDDDRLTIEILTGPSAADLLRREANIGLRNRRPEQPGLAARRLVSVAFAVYGTDDYLRKHPEACNSPRFEACDWIAFSPSGPKVPSLRWLEQHLQRDARLRCSTSQALLEAVLAGSGLTVLPCFVGDKIPELARASETIAELRHDQWLVSHDDDRHDSHIRQVSSRLSKLIRARKELFIGGQCREAP